MAFPGNHQPGESGHVQAHNDIEAALNKIAVGTDAWLIGEALNGSFIPVSGIVYDTTYGTITNMNFKWAHDTATTGVYAGTIDSTNGAILTFTATYLGSTTRTVTVTLPRNTAGQINAEPTAVVS